jgi:hypothetical protein
MHVEDNNAADAKKWRLAQIESLIQAERQGGLDQVEYDSEAKVIPPRQALDGIFRRYC